jgi:2-keto-3-deoxygluconate permease
VKIKATIEKIPGGMMVVPLVLGAMLNTFAPEALQVGGFTTALFKNGAAPLIGAFLLCMGAGIHIKAAPKSLLIGGGITFTKFVVAVALGFTVETFFGVDGLWGSPPSPLLPR